MGYLHSMVRHKESSAILIRLAYILGNLTTNFEEARQKLCDKTGQEKSSFLIIVELAVNYLEKDSAAQNKPSNEETKDKANPRTQQS